MNINKDNATISRHGMLLSSLGFMAFFLITFWPAFLFRTDLAASGDDASYISHAFTIGLDFDLDYSNELCAGKDYYYTAKGTMPSHPIGPGIIAAPFVAFFSIFDRISGHPVIMDHHAYANSWSFFGMLFSSSMCLAIGTLLFALTFKRKSDNSVNCLIPLLALSSGIAFYCHARFTMAHSYEYFLGSLIMYLSSCLIAIESKPRKAFQWRLALELGLVIAGVLSLMVRYANLHMLLLPSLACSYFGGVSWKPSRRLILELVSILLVTLAIFFIFSFLVYGELYPSFSRTYPNSPKAEMFESTSIIIRTISLIPNLGPLFFGSEFGLAWAFPALFLGIIGYIIRSLALLKSQASFQRKMLELTFLFFFFALPFAIVLNWKTTASAYGFRYLYSLMPLALAGSYTLLSLDLKRIVAGFLRISLTRWTKYIAYILCIAGLLSYFLFLTTQGLTPGVKENAFGVVHTYSSNGYLSELLKAVFTPKAWSIAMGRTAAVFLPLAVLIKTGLASLLPTSLVSSGMLDYYQGHPPVVLFQIIILAIIWGLLGSYAYVLWRKNEANNPDTLL